MLKYESEIRQIIGGYLKENQFGADEDMKSYGLDSLTFVKIVIDIENYFEIEFPYDNMSIDDTCTLTCLCEIIEEIKGKCNG